MCICIYIYIFIEREREAGLDTVKYQLHVLCFKYYMIYKANMLLNMASAGVCSFDAEIEQLFCVVKFWRLRFGEINEIYDIDIGCTYGQFSKFHVWFCGLDPGNLKIETVRTHEQHICF